VSDADPSAPAGPRPLAGFGPVAGGLAAVQAVGAALTLLITTGSGSATLRSVAAGVAATLAVVLVVVSALPRFRPAPPEPLVVLLLVTAAATSGATAAVTSTPSLAAGAVVAAFGLFVLGSTGSVAVVLAAATIAPTGGAMVAAGTDRLPEAAFAVAVVLAGCTLTAALRSVLAAQARAAQDALAGAETMRVSDPLTGTLNRRGLELMAGPLIEAARRRGEAVHALFVDVDGFTAVNEQEGYRSGDDVLIAVAEALRGSVRSTDVVCRVSGDEFLVVGPGTGTSPLEMERRARLLLRSAPPVPASVWDARLNIGSATLVPWDDGDLGSLIARSDQDMRLRRSLRRQSQDRRGDLGTSAPGQAAAPRTEV
jgi:diguanylate cyclase (GGDEF)-like protein